MRRRDALLYSLTSTLLLGACAEQPSAPTLTAARSVASAHRDVACVATDLIAATEAQLHSMIASSQPDDVIAVSGMIGVTQPVRPRAGTTITCVAPGDGLSALPDLAIAGYLVEIFQPDVTIQGLTLLTNGISDWAVYAERSDFEFEGSTPNGINARVLGNTVTCGQSGCAFFVGVAGSVAADNVFTAAGSASGIHIQGSGLGFVYRTDNLRVLRNRIVAISNSGNANFGGIRPRDGTNIIVQDNEIVGPWSNGIATTETLDATFERNSVDAARRYGLFVGSTTLATIQVRGLLARNNTLAGAENAIFVRRACTNVFVANKLSSASGTPVFFDASTGANNLMGGDNSVNVDNGAFDCDADGDIDPNFLTGRKKAGAKPGETMQAVMPPSGRGAAMH